MCCPSCCNNNSNSGNNQSTPVTPSEQCQTCRRATILRPRGSLNAASNPTASWLTTPCFHFDFQGVVSGSPGPYVLQFEGELDPPSCFTPNWTLEAAAGTLASATSLTPTHTEPASAGEGDVTLTGMRGTSPAGCTQTKRVKIYRDHLARDMENFGTGTDCRGPTWTFTRYGATITMNSRWNCHGGTRHIYNGSGTGSVGPADVAFLFDSSRLKREVTVTHTPTGGGSHPSLGPLVRGDVVAYFTARGDLAHTQTCTGNGTETYGANNVPLRFPGRPDVDEAWRWSTSPAGDWANDLQDGLGGFTPFVIRVYSRP